MTDDLHDPRAIYSNPWHSARWGIVAIALFVALLLLWGSVAPLSGAVIANGSFEVQGRRQSVQHPYGGVVTELRVREGQNVERGDVLVRLASADAQAQFDVLENMRAALLARRARLIAERDEIVEPDFATALGTIQNAGFDQIMENERALLDSRRRQYGANVDLIQQRIVQLQEQADGIQGQIGGLERQTASLEDETQGARQLLDQGYTPRTRVLELERAINESQTQSGARRSELVGVSEAIGEARLEIAKLERERISGVTEDLQQTDAQLAENAPKLSAAADMLARTEIRAPATGRIVGLSVFTEGGVVDAGVPLMDVVPAANPIFVEARLRLSDISDVTAGQSADVRLIGTPREVRPKLGATLTNISPDSLDDERTGEVFYALQLALDPAEVADAGMDLLPGMPVQVVIETTPRTLVGYLTGPLLDEVGGAFRER